VPAYIDQLRDSQLVQRLDREYELVDRLREGATDLLSGVAAPDTAVSAARRVVDGLFATISILVIAFLLSLYGARIRDWLVGTVRPGASARLMRVSEGMYRVISGYVAGALLVAITGAVAAAIFLTVVGVPYVPALAFWVGLMAMIPLVGSVLGAVPYVLVAFFSSSWQVGVASIVFFVVYQQIENHLVQPQIMRRTVRLNPLWVIIAVIAGAQLLGIVGALVAVPVAGMLQVALQEWTRAPGEAPPPEPPEPEPPPGAAAVTQTP
jgi:predicted PurR-regulated permease PerM